MTKLEKLTGALCLAVAAAAGDAQTSLYSYTVPAGGYAPNGNLTGYTDSVTGTWTMQYDPLNRLQNATASAGAYQGINLQWQYDSFGNRLSQTPSGNSNALVPVPWQARYNPNNQMTSTLAGTPTYDASGNLTFDGQATSVAYDAENRVCATANTNGAPGITQYIYNAEGQRVAKGHPISNPNNALFCVTDPSNFAPTATYVLGLSGEQVTEFDGSGNWQHTNVFNGGQLLATYDTRGLHFPQTDPLGTVRVQVSGTGAPEESCASLPFGDGLTCTGITDPTEHHFTGKERDTESGGSNGLDYFGARYYSSGMGRFMSPDPLGGHLEDPQTLNRYMYARNNPLIYTDSTGLDFNLDCGKNNGTTCQGGMTYYKDAKGDYQKTVIKSDDNGNLADQSGNKYTGTFDGKNVSFAGADGSKSNGSWIQGSDDTKGITGGGDLSNKFDFTFHNHGNGQSLYATFTYAGTFAGAESELNGAGYRFSASDQLFNLREAISNPDAINYRTPGDKGTGANSGHFLVNHGFSSLWPKYSVPTTGSMHTGETNPWTSIDALTKHLSHEQ